MAERVKACVFPGTFNPFTSGHMEIVLRAAAVFDRVVVAVSRGGRNGLPDADVRAQLIRCAVKDTVCRERITVMTFDGLLVQFCASVNADVIVRGLRSALDYEYERDMEIINKQLSPDKETVYFISAPQYAHISASRVRELVALGADISGIVPHALIDDINDIYRKRG